MMDDQAQRRASEQPGPGGNPAGNPHDATGEITWVLLAGGHLAHIYAVEDRRWINAKRIHGFEHPESRAQAPELVSDDLGRRRDSGRDAGPSITQRSKMDPKVSLKDQEKHAFAQQIVAHLEQARTTEQFDNLVLFAAPGVLGMLRSLMSKPLAQLALASVDKDLTFVSEHDMGKRLHREMHLDEPPGETYATGSADGRLRNTKR